MSKAATQALACWVVALALAVLALFVFLGAPGNSEGAGEAVGRLFALTGTAALVAWLVVHRKTPPWSWLRFVLLYVAMLIAVALVTAAGRARADEAWPFRVSFSPDWSSERMSGVSSAPQDQPAGVREQARWDGEDGAAVIGIFCSWRTTAEPIDLNAELDAIVRGVSEGFSAQGMTVHSERSEVPSGSRRQWRAASLRVERDGVAVMEQQMAVTATRRCFLTSTLAGTPRAFARQVPEFDAVLARLQSD